MAEIRAELVKQLREATHVSMMECKKALQETDGDIERATRLLRERGLAVAARRADRATNEGLIASAVTADGHIRSLVEVNCETDFVARNACFAAFVKRVAEEACTTDEPVAERLREVLAEKIAEIGENLAIRRNIRYRLQQPGALDAYIHLGGKVGVLVELGCTRATTATHPTFTTLLHDLTLQVAASNPLYISPDTVPTEVVQAEREIYQKQVTGKPPAVTEKIVAGKLQKFYQETCLVCQPFVREPRQSVGDLLAQKGRELNDTFTVRRFVRYQVGQ